MRTSVTPSASDPDETDEFPECVALVNSDGELTIADMNDNVETTYVAGDWHEVTVTNA